MLTLAIGLVCFVILYQRRVIAHQMEVKHINRQKELELIQASIQSEEEERMRIATELHDDVNATLASARLFLYKEKDTPYQEQIINQSKKLLDDSMNKIREISHKLQPATLQHLGLERSLQTLIETLDKSGAISARYQCVEPLPRIPENAELAVYRISQEILTNIIKHTGASVILFDTGIADGKIQLLFTHDGMGLTQQLYEDMIYKKGAIGLKNIVNRLTLIDATLAFYKEENMYKTKLTLPYNI